MKYHEICPCCGNKITAYTHNLNKPLVSALRQLTDFYEKNKTGCNIERDLRITHNQIANFQKLKYFNLVANTKNGWVPTQLAFDFISNEIGVFSPVATFKDQILPIDHPAWKTHNGGQILFMVKDVDQDSYKKREDYSSESSLQKKLF